MKIFISLFSEVRVKAGQHFASHPFTHACACCQITFKGLEEVLDCKNEYDLKNIDNLKQEDYLKH